MFGIQAQAQQLPAFGQAFGQAFGANNFGQDFIVINGTLSIYKPFDFNSYKLSTSIKIIELRNKSIKNFQLIPPDVKQVIVTDFDINIDNLPNGIEILQISSKFVQNGIYKYKLDNLPQTLLHLHINCEFDLPIDNLPNSITYLKIDSGFNQLVDNLPENLEFLDLGKSFNQSVNNLPSKLKYLKVGDCFNHPINNLPTGLKKLILGLNFNQPIENLPQLEYFEIIGIINFNYDYSAPNKVLTNLPNSLKTLKSESRNFTIDFVESVPPNVKNLYLTRCCLPVKFKNKIIEKIYINKYVQLLKNIPTSVEEITFNKPNCLIEDNKYIQYKFKDEEPDDNFETDSNNEPDYKKPKTESDNKTKFTNTCDYNKDLTNAYVDFRLLPNTVKKLTIKSIGYDCRFPENLTSLVLENCFRSIDFNFIPDSIEYLELVNSIDNSSYNNNIIITKLPANIKYLVHSYDILNIDEILFTHPELNIIKKNLF